MKNQTAYKTTPPPPRDRREMMLGEPLRQCPFCGHAKAKMEWQAVTPIFEDDKTRNWFVECQKCGAQGPCSNREDKARDYWQERHYEVPALR